MMSSRSLRAGFRDGDKKRFFASCCVIVLAAAHQLAARPIELDRFLQLVVIDAVVLPEGGVFGDQHRSFQVRRNSPIVDPLAEAAVATSLSSAPRRREVR